MARYLDFDHVTSSHPLKIILANWICSSIVYLVDAFYNWKHVKSKPFKLPRASLFRTSRVFFMICWGQISITFHADFECNQMWNVTKITVESYIELETTETIDQLLDRNEKKRTIQKICDNKKIVKSVQKWLS